LNHLILGGAGFIGANLARRLIQDNFTEKVILYDNLSVGTFWRIKNLIEHNPYVRFFFADIENEEILAKAMQGIDIVWLLAANADISASVENPGIDFYKGTLLTQLTLEAMRIAKVKKIIFSSGAGVFGNLDLFAPDENYGPLVPISPYGANKLASEALISAYSHMFGITARIFRFANVVGGMQTHGICFDLIRKLRKDSSKLEILGNGSQSKSYTHINDILNGIFVADQKSDKVFDVFNVSNESYINVKTIAEIVVQEMGIKFIEYKFGESNIGWPGDVNTIRFNSNKLKNLGWIPLYNSKKAIELSVKAMLQQEVLE
jgi:UDP-glucose 4-epimerase